MQRHKGTCPFFTIEESPEKGPYSLAAYQEERQVARIANQGENNVFKDEFIATEPMNEHVCALCKLEAEYNAYQLNQKLKERVITVANAKEAAASDWACAQTYHGNIDKHLMYKHKVIGKEALDAAVVNMFEKFRAFGKEPQSTPPTIRLQSAQEPQPGAHSWCHFDTATDLELAAVKVLFKPEFGNESWRELM